MAWVVYYEDYLITGNWRGLEAKHTFNNEPVEMNICKKQLKKPTTTEPQYLKEYPLRINK